MIIWSTCLLLTAAVISAALQALSRFVRWDSTAYVYLAMIVRQLLSWGLPVVLMRRRFPMAGRLAPVRSADCAAAVLIGAAAQYLLAPLTELVRDALDFAPSTLPMPAGGMEWVLGILALVIVPAVTEEIFFRGCIQGNMMFRQWNGMEWVLPAVIFAVLHTSVPGFPAYLVIGSLLTVTMMSTMSLVPCMLLHAAYNAMALAWAVFPAQRHGIGMALAAAALIVYWVMMKRRCIRPAEKGEEALLPLCLAAMAAVFIRLI